MKLKVPFGNKISEPIEESLSRTLQRIKTIYQPLIDDSPDALALSDKEGTIIAMNRKLAQMHGFENEMDLIGTCGFNLFPPEERQRAVDLMKKGSNAEPGSITHFDALLLRKDGTRFWGEVSAKLVLLPGGHLPFLLAAIRDISERRQIGAALKESKERYENFISQISDGIYRFELDEPMPVSLPVEDQIDYLYQHMILAECNPSFLAMYGIKDAREVIGKKQKDIFKGIEDTDNRAAKRTFIESGYRIINQLTQEADHQGNEITINNNVIGIIENNRLLRMWGTQTNITEQKKAERILRESEEKYRTLVEKVNEAILIIQDGAFTFMNKKACDLLQVPANTLEGKPYIDFIWPEDRELVRSNCESRIAGKPTPESYDFRLTVRGSAVWVFMSAAVILWKGKQATLAILTDITERKARADATNKSLLEKEALLSEVYHRVKNNMQVISSLFNLQISQTHNDETRHALQEGRNRLRAMSLVHDKLYRSSDFSNIDLASYIRELAIHLFAANLINQEQIQLETNLEDELNLNINSAVPCGLILNELISNALEHGFPEKRKGIIRIDLNRTADGTFILIVADDGIGFPNSIDIHQPESLGLQIVNLLVSQLDGSIELDRRSGTAFKIFFRELKYMSRF